jgi:hypothetical protein
MHWYSAPGAIRRHHIAPQYTAAVVLRTGTNLSPVSICCPASRPGPTSDVLRDQDVTRKLARRRSPTSPGADRIGDLDLHLGMGAPQRLGTVRRGVAGPCLGAAWRGLGLPALDGQRHAHRGLDAVDQGGRDGGAPAKADRTRDRFRGEVRMIELGQQRGGRPGERGSALGLDQVRDLLGLLAGVAGCRLAWWALIRGGRLARVRRMGRSSGLRTGGCGCS